MKRLFKFSNNLILAIVLGIALSMVTNLTVLSAVGLVSAAQYLILPYVLPKLSLYDTIGADLTMGDGVMSKYPIQNLHGVIQVGEVDVALPLESINISVAGKLRVDINDQQSLAQAYSKWTRGYIGGADALIGNAIPITRSGKGLGGVSCNVNLTNAGATTPSVMGHSKGRFEKDVDGINTGTTLTVQNKDNMTFGAEVPFDMLAFDPTNLARAEVVFADDWSDVYLPAELKELFSADNDSDVNAQLGGVTVVNNWPVRMIDTISLYASGGTIEVLVVGQELIQ